MTHLFKDRYKLGLIMATLFFISIVASLYQIYRLPHNLMLGYDNHPALTDIYIMLGLTFLLGGLAIWWSLTSQTEVIVYRNREAEQTSASHESSEENKTTISLDSVRDSINNSDNLPDVLRSGLQAICRQVDAGQGAIYIITEHDGRKKVELKSGYALNIGESTEVSYEMGEGLIGQTAATAKTLYLDDVPEGYVKIISGLGSASPRYLLIAPVKHNERVSGVIELASFTPITEDERKFVEESAQLIADRIATKKA